LLKEEAGHYRGGDIVVGAVARFEDWEGFSSALSFASLFAIAAMTCWVTALVRGSVGLLVFSSLPSVAVLLLGAAAAYSRRDVVVDFCLRDGTLCVVRRVGVVQQLDIAKIVQVYQQEIRDSLELQVLATDGKSYKIEAAGVARQSFLKAWIEKQLGILSAPGEGTRPS
jgi:hypothetical protein